MTEEHYQDGIKLPTEMDLLQWKLAAQGGMSYLNLYKIKLENGHLYATYNAVCFVPGNSTSDEPYQAALEKGYSEGYKQCSKDSKEWHYPTSEEILNQVADLSIKLNKMQDSLQEFEKEKIAPLNSLIKVVDYKFGSIFERIQKLEEYQQFQLRENDILKEMIAVEGVDSELINKKITRLEEHQKGLVKENREYSEHFIEEYEKHDLRLNKLEEHHTRQIDENRKVDRKIERLDYVESLFPDIDKTFAWFRQERDLILERIYKLESALNPEFKVPEHVTTNQGHPWINEEQDCAHEFGYSLLLSNPPKQKCNKCGMLFDVGFEASSSHPRDTLQLCKHGAPVKTCTACY